MRSIDKKILSLVIIALLSISPKFSLAESGNKVKVIIPSTNRPPVEYEGLSNSAKQLNPESCLDSSAQNIYKNNKNPFKDQWSNELMCAQTMIDSTLLNEKGTAINNSISVLSNFIDSTKLSISEVEKMTTLDGSAFRIISAGDQIDNSYKRASGVALKCVQDDANSEKRSYPIGSMELDKGKAYANTTAKIEEQMTEIKKNNSELYKAYTSEPSGNKGKITNGTLDRLISLKSVLSGKFILLTDNAYSKYHGNSNSISLKVNIERNSDGKPMLCKDFVGWGLETKLGLGGVKGDFVRSTVTIDGNVFSGECIPESYLLGELKSGISRSITAYTALKTDYEKQLNQINTQLSKMSPKLDKCANGDTQQSFASSNFSKQSLLKNESSIRGSDTVNPNDIAPSIAGGSRTTPYIRGISPDLSEEGQTVRIYADYLDINKNFINISRNNGTISFSSPAYRDSLGWYLKFVVKDLSPGEYRVSIDNDTYGFSDEIKDLKIVPKTVNKYRQSSTVIDSIRNLFDL